MSGQAQAEHEISYYIYLLGWYLLRSLPIRIQNSQLHLLKRNGGNGKVWDGAGDMGQGIGIGGFYFLNEYHETTER